MDQPGTDWIEDLLDRHGRVGFAAAYRVLGNAEDAEDVVQEVMLRLLRSGPPREAVENWPAYLRTAAVRRAIDLLRHRRRRPAECELHEAITDARGAPPWRAIEQAEQAEALRAGLRQLSPRDAAAFTLKYFEDLDHETIGRQLGVPARRVALILHRARRRLARLLGPVLERGDWKAKNNEPEPESTGIGAAPGS